MEAIPEVCPIFNGSLWYLINKNIHWAGGRAASKEMPFRHSSVGNTMCHLDSGNV